MPTGAPFGLVVGAFSKKLSIPISIPVLAGVPTAEAGRYLLIEEPILTEVALRLFKRVASLSLILATSRYSPRYNKPIVSRSLLVSF